MANVCICKWALPTRYLLVCYWSNRKNNKCMSRSKILLTTIVTINIKTTSYWHHVRPMDVGSTHMMSIWCRFDLGFTRICNGSHGLLDHFFPVGWTGRSTQWVHIVTVIHKPDTPRHYARWRTLAWCVTCFFQGFQAIFLNIRSIYK